MLQPSALSGHQQQQEQQEQFTEVGRIHGPHWGASIRVHGLTTEAPEACSIHQNPLNPLWAATYLGTYQACLLTYIHSTVHLLCEAMLTRCFTLACVELQAV